MDILERVEVNVLGDGHCFVNALSVALWHDYGLRIPVSKLVERMCVHMLLKSDDYLAFFTPNRNLDVPIKQQYINQVTDFFSVTKRFNQSVVDLVVTAAAKALNMDIIIYSCGLKGHIQKQHHSPPRPLSPDPAPIRTASVILNRQHYTAAVRSIRPEPVRILQTEMQPSQDILKSLEDVEAFPHQLSRVAKYKTASTVPTPRRHLKDTSVHPEETVSSPVGDLHKAGAYRPPPPRYDDIHLHRDTYTYDLPPIRESEREDRLDQPSALDEMYNQFDDTHDVYTQHDLPDPTEVVDLTKEVPPQLQSAAPTSDQHYIDLTGYPDVFSDSGSSSQVSSVPSEASSSSSIGRGIPFPFDLFRATEPTVVTHIPGDIDGDVLYKVENTTRETYSRLTTDRRYFKMNTSGASTVNVIQKTGRCLGHYECPNLACAFRLTSPTREPCRSRFKNVEKDVKSCRTCGSMAVRLKNICSAMKVVQCHLTRGYTLVYHLGAHRCYMKPDDRQRKERIRLDLTQADLTGQLSANELIRRRIGKEVCIGDIERAREVADAYADHGMTRRIQQEVVLGANPNQESEYRDSFDAVGSMKKKLDETDNKLIYRINNSLHGVGSDYVFKASTETALIGIAMDNKGTQKTGPMTPLQGELCFFDGKHGRVRGFVSLALWIIHPVTLFLVRLCSMDVRTENTADIVTFFELWNQVLEDVSGIKGYKFNPYGFMCDNASWNLQAIEKVYGKRFGVERRIATCGWHFMQNVQRKDIVSRLPLRFQKLFILLCRSLVRTTQVAQFDKIWSYIDRLSTDGQIDAWKRFWRDRRSTSFAPFRMDGVPGVNLAEQANAGWSRKTKLTLVEGASDDVTTMIQQNGRIKSIMANRGGTGGRAKTQHEKTVEFHAREKKRAADFIAIFDDPVALQRNMDALLSNESEAFVPKDKSRHRPRKEKDRPADEVLQYLTQMTTQSVRGRRGQRQPHDDETTLHGRSADEVFQYPTQTSTQSVRGRRRRPQHDDEPRPQRGRTSSTHESQRGAARAQKITLPTSMEKVDEQLQVAIDILGKRPRPNPRRPVSTTISLNWPCIRKTNIGNISVCQGCSVPISKEHKKFPQDMVFQRDGEREKRNARDGTRYFAIAKCYYHLNLKCLMNKDHMVQLHMVTANDDEFVALKEENLVELAKRGLLESLIGNKL